MKAVDEEEEGSFFFVLPELDVCFSSLDPDFPNFVAVRLCLSGLW